ncbi:type III secretion system protein [Pseudomonas sp. NPDC090202]|uniref:type III secretion system protein n=1 Tax=unclassified Pseudomonas TaxID=196821 RepID=UPI0037F846B8
MKTLSLRHVDTATAALSRRLGAGASLHFSAQAMAGELSLQPLLDNRPPKYIWFSSAIGLIGLSDAEALLSLLGELPVTLAGTHQPWYWQVINQQFSAPVAELLGPLEPLSDITALPVDTVSWRIEVHLGEQRLHGRICAEAPVLARLLDGRGWHLWQQPLAEDMPFSQALELGEVSLSLAQLASLQPGDVLLPPLCHFDSDGNGRLRLAGRQWAVHTDSHAERLFVQFSHEEALEDDR